MGPVLLKNVLRYDQMQPADVEAVVQRTLEVFQQQRMAAPRGLSRLVGVVARHGKPEGWAEMAEALQQMLLPGADGGQTELALDILSQCSSISNVGVAHYHPILQQLRRLTGLADGGGDGDDDDDAIDADVLAMRCRALRLYLEQHLQQNPDQLGLPVHAVMQMIRRASHLDDEAISAETLEELTGFEEVLLEDAATVVTDCLTMIEDQQGGSNARALAATFMAAMATTEVPKRVRREVQGMLPRMVTTLLGAMCQVEDDPDWEERMDDPLEMEVGSELIDAVEGALDELAVEYGSMRFMGALWPALSQMTVSPDWRQRRAANVALAQVAEGLADQLAPAAAGIVQRLVAMLEDPHPRVRFT